MEGTGNVTELNPVKGLNVSIDNLTHSKSYVVTVQAFTVGLGPSARRVVQPVAISNRVAVAMVMVPIVAPDPKIVAPDLKEYFNIN